MKGQKGFALISIIMAIMEIFLMFGVGTSSMNNGLAQYVFDAQEKAEEAQRQEEENLKASEDAMNSAIGVQNTYEETEDIYNQEQDSLNDLESWMDGDM